MTTPWRSSVEIGVQIGLLSDTARLDELWSLSAFARSALIKANFASELGWADAVSLTTDGERLIESAHSQLNGSTRADLSLAMFQIFYHHDLLIDHLRSDPSRITMLLDNALRTGEMKLPYVFGRQLYDRFNDMNASNRTDHLLPGGHGRSCKELVRAYFSSRRWSRARWDFTQAKRHATCRRPAN